MKGTAYSPEIAWQGSFDLIELFKKMWEGVNGRLEELLRMSIEVMECHLALEK